MKKKIIITGAAGFIGSRLSELLVEKGYDVYAFDRYNSFNSFGWLDNSEYKKYIKFCFGDIRDYETVYKNFKNIDSVIHLAALVGIPYSYEAPISYIKTNIEGTYNVLEVAKKLNYKNIVITSTSEVYGTAQKIPINEKHPLVGQSPYSASKIAADQISISYNKSFQLPVKIARPFNTYGPRQSLRAIIPQIILQLLNSRKFIYFGNIKPTRDLTYVDDTCSGFIEILNKKKFLGKVTNIGSKNETSVEKLIHKISRIMGITKKIKIERNRIRPKDSEVERLVCDNSFLLKNSNWKPKYTLNDGLVETIKWVKEEYRKNFKNDKYIL
tara:strand:- start:193 stop:1173 length:981 start_codon:yes stop_codon:yes gene_type:complete